MAILLKLVLPNAVYKCHTPPVSGGGVSQVYKGQWMKDSFANLKCLKLLWRLEEEGHMPGNFELGTLFIEALKRKSHMRLYYFGNKYWFHWFSNMLLPDGFKTQDVEGFWFFCYFFKCVFLVAGRNTGFCSACKLCVSNSSSFVMSAVSPLKLWFVFIWAMCGLLMQVSCFEIMCCTHSSNFL